MKFGVRVRTCDPSATLNFIKIASRGIPFFGKFIPKINNFSDLGGLKAHILRVTAVKFGVRVRSCDTLPRA